MADKSKKVIIAGPCVLEESLVNLEIAQTCREVVENLGCDYIFKASYDKANRTSRNSYRGPGQKRGLHELSWLKSHVGCRVTSDVHDVAEVMKLSHTQDQPLDVIQIPAMLSRQTDLLTEAACLAADKNLIVNIKKGQFMSRNDAYQAWLKVSYHGAECWVTERGNCFGYGDVVVDPLNVFRYPTAKIIVDCTHTNRGEMGNTVQLGRMAIACEADGLFLETTIDPDRAGCDGDKMVPLDKFKETLECIFDGLGGCL